MKHPHLCLADFPIFCWKGRFYWRVKIIQFSSHCSHLPLHQKWFQICNMGVCFWSWWYTVTWQLGYSSIQTPPFRCLWSGKRQKQKHVSQPFSQKNLRRNRYNRCFPLTAFCEHTNIYKYGASLLCQFHGIREYVCEVRSCHCHLCLAIGELQWH